MSIGYEVTMTPLQILTFYNAMANDGVMVKPMFVSEIKEGGTVSKKYEPVVINPAVCSQRTALKDGPGIWKGSSRTAPASG